MLGVPSSLRIKVTAEDGDEHAEAMMRLLVDAGADANKKSKDGWTVSPS